MSPPPDIPAVPHGGAPPDPPELPEGVDPAPRWPAFYAPLAFVAAFGITIVVSIIAGVIAAAAGADLDDGTPPSMVVALTLVQAVVLCATAVWFASRTRRPRAWHFGFRRAPFWRALGWAALGMFAFYLFAAAYSAIADPAGEQTVAEDLGADQGTLALILAGIVVIVVAPIAEEFFFRGFFYRALRSRLGILSAAAVNGALFGLIHFTGEDTLELLPILGFLGFVFCLVYERTKTLYTVIGLHAFNNSLAYGFATETATVSLVLGPLMLIACLIGPRLIHRAPGAVRA